MVLLAMPRRAAENRESFHFLSHNARRIHPIPKQWRTNNTAVNVLEVL